jgi:CubicO group peptidase (beta-lactamase class C family)
MLQPTRFVLSALFCIFAARALAQNTDSELFRTLKTKDSLLFNVGFNNSDITQFEKLISENFEFYHDKAGVTSTKANFIAGMKNVLFKLPYKARRELEENSLEVHPLLKNGTLYGAIQTGTHRFYALEKDKPEYITSVAKFTHLWLLDSTGNWKLARVLSYDHDEKSDAGAADDPLLFKDKAVTEKWLAKNRIPTLGLGSIKDGKIEEVTVYGELAAGVPAPRNTIFNVASLTKPITALVALKLASEGKWNLNEPLYTYWLDPDIANDPRAKLLTTRHILSHQSGFPNWRGENHDRKLAFEFDPGTKYQYSGEGYEYLRMALEKKFHTTLDLLAGELIFRPLGMNDTRFFWDKTMDEKRFAPWHDGEGNLYKTYKNTEASAADDLLTTVEDYSKFMIHIMNGGGLSKELYAQMTANQVRIKNKKYFGLGWWVDEINENGENALVHGGDDKGVHTIAFILPKTKRGLVIFTNCDNGTDVYIPVILAYLGKTGQAIIDAETKD